MRKPPGVRGNSSGGFCALQETGEDHGGDKEKYEEDGSADEDRTPDFAEPVGIEQPDEEEDEGNDDYGKIQSKIRIGETRHCHGDSPFVSVRN